MQRQNILTPGAAAAATGAIAGPDDPHAALYRKVTWRLLPILFACYVIAYLDRVNIGYAQLHMRGDLGFTDQVYGLAAGLFFVTYFLCEIPSNIYLQRVGARKTLVRILLLWGAASCATMFVVGPLSFYAVRLVLGVFEAGLAPGVMFYLTLWYPNRRRAQVTAVFLSGSAVAGVIGAPVSGLILDGFQGVLGFKGWQWMFLLEGLPAILLSLCVLLVLSDRPHEANWLSAEEKAALSADIARDASRAGGGHGFGAALRDPRIYFWSAAWFTLVCGLYAITFWMPVMLQAAGVRSATEVGLWSIIPYGIGSVGMVLISRQSDRCDERRWHYAVNVVLGASCLLMASLAGTQLALVLALLAVATATLFAAMPIFYAIPMAYLPERAAAGGLALINCLGLTGGFFSPMLLGWVRTQTGSLTAGLWVMAGMMLAGVAILLLTTRKMVPSPVPVRA
ncbi:putative metabolite transport protein NicT [Rhodovastum atsumiense]|uniref:MFS transporter n=1 Tax=Rhodovastum atsumiense TaxID=504468 RepID=A0A5M6IY16_9PROT|nr:MFS transporter [Rhodovastum atsumiense]KAA5612255.1 MFS transporter [Rhodovastum atsumiense]CAH2601578.1 putative metabolite transport protein NicT [Rhodovastum atsumiense]